MFLSCVVYMLIFICLNLNLKDSITVPIQWHRRGETIRRRLPCSIPDSLPGQTNYMFCNGYNLWCCSRASCGHSRRRCAGDKWYTNSLWLFFSQFLAFPQFQATRAVSGYSVPIIACVAAGAGAIIRLFGPESMGGVGDFGARIDAEIARTGLPDDEVGHKVHISVSGF